MTKMQAQRSPVQTPLMKLWYTVCGSGLSVRVSRVRFRTGICLSAGAVVRSGLGTSIYFPGLFLRCVLFCKKSVRNKVAMADLVIAFGIGVAAASFTHLRGPLWALLPTVGFLTATGASTCRRVSRALIKKTLENTAVVPSTPIDLPRIKRPVASVVTPVTQAPEESPCASRCDCTSEKSEKEVKVDAVTGLQDDHCEFTLQESETPVVIPPAPKTPPRRSLFEGKFARDEFDVPGDYEPVSRPPGIALELFHQGAEGEKPEPVSRPPGIQLDLLVSGRKDPLESLNTDILS